MSFIMPVLPADGSLAALALGFAIAGLLGSWHCALMCGPSACYLAANNKLRAYHLGRLLGYLTLGAGAGYLSEKILNFSFSNAVWIVSIVVVILFVSFLLSFSFSKQVSFQIYKKLQFFRTLDSGLMIGLSSSLLPCGWLYSFVAAATAARSPGAGMVVMFIFWLTTLPSLSLAPLALKGLIRKSPQNHQRISQAVLLCASIFSVSLFLLSHGRT